MDTADARVPIDGCDAHKIIAWAAELQCAVSARERFSYPLHVHAVHEVLGILEGTAILEHSRGRLVLASGDLVALWPDEPHGGRALGRAGARFLSVQVPASSLRSAGIHVPEGLPGPLPSRVVRGALCERACASIARASEPRALLAVADLVFATLTERLTLHGSASGARWTRQLPTLLSTLPDDRLSSRDCAARLGLHPSYFATSFKALYGVTPRELAIARRVERARLHLMSGAGLADVAEACGFADQAHLTRCFRRVYGLPPSAFRKRNSVVGRAS